MSKNSIKVDCKYYARDDDKDNKGGCKVLTERVCEKKKCSFYCQKSADIKSTVES